MIRLLSFGNSFSDDSHRWLYDLAAAVGVELEAHNYVIGGCPLEWHAQNMKNGEARYLYQRNGLYIPEPEKNLRTFGQGLHDGRWDIITLQQASGCAGRPESFQPYLDELLAAIRTAQPQAKVFFHQTWEYEYSSDHPDFPHYGRDCAAMHTAVRNTCRRFAAENGLGLIPTGDAIHIAKQLPAFDSEHGGLSLYRDGFHLGWIYGRYLASCVWLKTLCGVLPAADAFLPADDSLTADPVLLAQLQSAAAAAVSGTC